MIFDPLRGRGPGGLGGGGGFGGPFPPRGYVAEHIFPNFK